MRSGSIAGRIMALVMTGVWVLQGAVTAAQTQTPDTFVPATAEDLARETLPATPFVFVAYAVVWVMVFGYVFLLWRRLSRIERDLAQVRARLPGAGPRT